MASRLQRAIQPMPDDIALLLEQRGLREAYDRRPDYQRNDYLAWISRAKRDDTRQKRLNQMLDELEIGGVYMGMAHSPSGRSHERLDPPWSIDTSNLKRSKHEAKMRWLAENEVHLSETYPGLWVAIADEGVVAFGESLKTVESQAKEKGFQDPIMHSVPSLELLRATFVR